jgi:antirestriction protein
MEIKIYLGDLGAYNEGRIIGEWLTLPMDEEELRAKYNKYTHNGQHDFYIADWECEIDKLVGEYSNPFKLNETASTLAEMNEHDLARIDYLISEGETVEYALDNFENVDFYPDMNLKQLAEHFVDEGLFGEIPVRIACYLDYEAIGRDLGFDGYDEMPAGVFRRY